MFHTLFVNVYMTFFFILGSKLFFNHADFCSFDFESKSYHRTIQTCARHEYGGLVIELWEISHTSTINAQSKHNKSINIHTFGQKQFCE